MKPNPIPVPTAPSRVDRLATSEEVRLAFSPLAGGLDPDEHPTEDACEIAIDLGGYIRITAEEFDTFRIIEELSEGLDAWVN